jgi:Zn-dependent peptidase ImmA (M78 family)
VTHPIGGHDRQALLLTLETERGPIILLNENLGTQNQKMDLAHEIQQALKTFADNKNIPR